MLPSEATATYDVACIGFGPSNIALAIALEERCPELKIVFLEAQAQFGWHTDMLFADATMQVSFLKDLVTFRNPTSRFSFVSFLHSKNRLAAFANLGSFTPSRQEFHQYLEWCADQFVDRVRYGHRVVAIDAPESNAGARLVCETNSGERSIFAHCVVDAAGLQGILPDGVELGPRVMHCKRLLPKLHADQIAAGSHVMVAGGGQSAAESVLHLLKTVPDVRVSAVVSRFGYMPADDTPFVNEIFDAKHVDTFFNAEPSARARMLGRHASTNYAAVDEALIQELYQFAYDEQVNGTCRFNLRRCERLVGACSDESGVRVQLCNQLTHVNQNEQVDWLVCATGFKPACPSQFLQGKLLAAYRNAMDDQSPLSRSYRVKFSDPALPDFYTIHKSEPTHGLTATLISNMAIRAGEIASDILARRSARVVLQDSAGPKPPASPVAQAEIANVT